MVKFILCIFTNELLFYGFWEAINS